MGYWIGIIISFLAAYLIFRVIVRRDYLQRGSLSFLSIILEFVAFALHANMLIIYLGTMAYLNFKTSLGGKPKSLKQSGLYRWTRTPQLLSCGLTLLGIVILRPSVYTAAWFFLYATIL